jgi:hypothetical protein
VKHGHELVVKVLVEKPGQAERDQVKDLAAVHDVALDLVSVAAALAEQLASAEPQRSDARLQPVPVTAAGLRKPDKETVHVNMGQTATTGSHVLAQSRHVTGKIKGLLVRPCRQPRRGF